MQSYNGYKSNHHNEKNCISQKRNQFHFHVAHFLSYGIITKKSHIIGGRTLAIYKRPAIGLAFAYVLNGCIPAFKLDALSIFEHIPIFPYCKGHGSSFLPVLGTQAFLFSCNQSKSAAPREGLHYLRPLP